MDLSEPWFSEPDADWARTVEERLKSELPPGHLLAGESLRLVGRRQDRDDYLFDLSSDRWAIVHVTWQRETDPRWPNTQVFGSTREVVARIKQDQAEFR